MFVVKQSLMQFYDLELIYFVNWHKLEIRLCLYELYGARYILLILNKELIIINLAGKKLLHRGGRSYFRYKSPEMT